MALSRTLASRMPRVAGSCLSVLTVVVISVASTGVFAITAVFTVSQDRLVLEPGWSATASVSGDLISASATTVCGCRLTFKILLAEASLAFVT